MGEDKHERIAAELSRLAMLGTAIRFVSYIFLLTLVAIALHICFVAIATDWADYNEWDDVSKLSWFRATWIIVLIFVSPIYLRLLLKHLVETNWSKWLSLPPILLTWTASFIAPPSPTLSASIVTSSVEDGIWGLVGISILLCAVLPKRSASV